MDKSEMKLEELVVYFNTYNRSEGKSPCSPRWYRQTLGNLLEWFAESGRPTTLGAINENVIREFIIWLLSRHVRRHRMAMPTVNCRVRALRVFFNWLYYKRYTETHLLQDVKPPRLRFVSKLLSKQELSNKSLFCDLRK
jgi:site-specific recombinase XerD